MHRTGLLLTLIAVIVASAADAQVGPWDRNRPIHGVKPEWFDIEDSTGLVHSMALNMIESAYEGRVADVYILEPNMYVYEYRFHCVNKTASLLRSSRADPVGPRSVMGGFLARACEAISKR